ncbi:hypothetical protein MGYG_04201 [Nannizzia gypsea CBS 118893]|uniref:Uncharacterized protein n=1 Tax=Arthroderma gypseum (strain ATCC MYA-4604 / CBS 118893) TaxID=535722 RepID=E4URS7_ARTGP|nr:hypothetical protein MGYG_04201 [Nannizzia gypsea CBS 118893]EFR01199.1 hypothetical protein MGYG_04201 [Nannizzia gypsea CBS 118893]
MPASSSSESPRLKVYLAWVDIWLNASGNRDDTQKPPPMDVDDLSSLFQDSSLSRALDPALLLAAVTSFQQRYRKGEIILAGTRPPSCEDTDLLSERYNPRVQCTCDGISPMSSVKDASLTNVTACRSIEKMLVAQRNVIKRDQEWNGHGLFTAEKLRGAVEELIFCNFDMQGSPTICSGASAASITPIKAPDRRPNPLCDNAPRIFNKYFPTSEKIKLCADAKYFYAMACGGSPVDEGILRAIADAGNDVLIGDYCEAATEETLKILQKNGAAAVAFLKACNLAGIVSSWQLDILAAAHIQFRVLGYYRNHAVSKIPGGLYGSRMTHLTTQRHIDIANAVGIVAASLATGQRINEAEYMKLSYGTTLVNDLVDLRSDTMRKQRENPVLRGVRGSACQYLKEKLLECIICARELIESKKLLAMVTMAFCNWTVMASHHKLYELVHGVREGTAIAQCEYDSLDEQYDRLLEALQPYGSLGSGGPLWELKRMELDKLYHGYRRSPESHSAWLADMVRLLLKPSTFRRIVDVVHYSWTDDVGEVDYCP